MDNFIDLCVEEINDYYYYAQYYDFKIIIEKNTGYVNATKLCIQMGKNLGTWLQHKKTTELLKDIRVTRTGAKYERKVNEAPKQCTGTYIHPDLLPSLVIWLSNDFYFKCTEILLKKNCLENTKKPEHENHELRNMMKKLLNVVQEMKSDIVEKTDYTNQKLDKIFK